MPFERLSPQIGVDPKVRSWNFPDVWPGGEWKLANIVDYMQSGAFALMRNAARYRERWLRDFYRIGKDAVAEPKAGEPFAFLIPPVAIEDFWRFEGYARLLEILKRGDVKMTEVDEPFEADGKKYPAGTTIILMRQPYGAFAKTLLERQHYPDLREYPGGPPRRPYDVTAHTLPLLMGVNVAQVNHPFRVPTEPKTSGGIGAQRPVNNAAPRVGLYKSYVASMDEGWTRWMLEKQSCYDQQYSSLEDAEVRAGGLSKKYKVIIIPDQSPRTILDGYRKGSMPEELTGGLGKEGVKALREFVEQGGTLVTLNNASDFAIEQFDLPLRDISDGLKRTEFYCPGSILRTILDTTHPIAAGMPRESIAWVEDSPVFEIKSDPSALARVKIIARYPDSGTPLLSGWLLGAERIRGKAALVEVGIGRGRVYLFGFRPQYRGQSLATYPLLFNAIAGAR